MKLSRRWLPGFVLLCLSSMPTANATEIRIEQLAATSQGYLYLELELIKPFEGIYLEALQSGLPTTLHYTFEVWRQRSGWWDKLEQTFEIEYRLLRDLLNDEYLAVTPEGTEVFADLDSLTKTVCVFRRNSYQDRLFLPRNLRAWEDPDEATLSPKKHYYVTITVKLAPLSVEDLNELDDWLKGTIRGGGNETRGGISGLSRTIGGMLMSMTGFGDKTIRSRTPHFRPGEIPAQPLRLNPPANRDEPEDPDSAVEDQPEGSSPD